MPGPTRLVRTVTMSDDVAEWLTRYARSIGVPMSHVIEIGLRNLMRATGEVIDDAPEALPLPLGRVNRGQSLPMLTKDETLALTTARDVASAVNRPTVIDTWIGDMLGFSMTATFRHFRRLQQKGLVVRLNDAFPPGSAKPFGSIWRVVQFDRVYVDSSGAVVDVPKDLRFDARGIARNPVDVIRDFGGGISVAQNPSVRPMIEAPSKYRPDGLTLDGVPL